MNQQTNDNLSLNPEVELMIKNDINNAFEKTLNKKWKKFFFTKKVFYWAIGLLITGFLTMILGSIIFIVKSEIDHTFISILPLIVIGFIIIVIAGFTLGVQGALASKIRRFLEIDILKYWKAIGKQNQSWEFIAFGKVFTLPMNDDLHGYHIDNWIENVLVGKINGQLFNIGSIAEKIVEKDEDGKTESVTYNRYLFYLQEVNNQFVTRITPENVMTRLKAKFSHKIRLESSEFEKLFAVDYHDPIGLRKLLTPKVMSKMIDIASEQQIPIIDLETNHVTLMKYYNDVDITSNHGTVCHIPKLVINQEKLLNSTLNMFKADFVTINNFIEWIKAFDFQNEWKDKSLI